MASDRAKTRGHRLRREAERRDDDQQAEQCAESLRRHYPGCDHGQ
jgi:hypothetical protein